MTPRLVQTLSSLDPRVLALAMLLIAAGAASEAWLLVLRKPLAQYRELRESRVTLAQGLASAASQQEELGRASAEFKQVADRLSGELRAPAADEQLAVSLMSDLDREAASNGIVLTSVKPGARRRVLDFEEVSFEVGAQGRYVVLCEWLLGLERTLGSLATVTEFTMKSIDEGRQVALSLKLAVYRSQPATGEAK